MKAKLPKIKIPQQDLNAFGMESLVVDPFWYDIYGITTELVDKHFEKTTI